MSEQEPRSSIASQQSETEETGIREQAQEYADQAKNKTGEIANQVNVWAKDQAASGLERAAQVAHQRASASGGMPAEAGTRVANVIEDTAKYVRTRDTNDVWEDVAFYVRSHPIQALAAAVVGGFVLGKLFRS
jgi:hypothetical protein